MMSKNAFVEAIAVSSSIGFFPHLRTSSYFFRFVGGFAPGNVMFLKYDCDFSASLNSRMFASAFQAMSLYNWYTAFLNMLRTD